MKHIYNLKDLLKTAESYYQYLDGKISFDKFDRPILKKEFFLEQWPDDVVPIQKIKAPSILNKQNKVLCFFGRDKDIYVRLANVFDELDLYKKYLGIVQPDITVTKDMDIEFQNIIMLIDQLFIAILAVNGIKIVANTRTASVETNSNLSILPKNIMCCSGFLGCSISENFSEASEYVDKILGILPSKLIIYGKKDFFVNEQLENLGIDYRYFDGFHTASKRRCVA